MTRDEVSYADVAGRDIGRIAALSDGVYVSIAWIVAVQLNFAIGPRVGIMRRV